jgi:NhaA family Na+:H+ antiporter
MSSTITKLFDTILRLLKHEAAGGVILMLTAVWAMIVANSFLSGPYLAYLQAEVSVTVNGVGVAKPWLLWINDGLMAVFFFLVGLELKREIMEGKLKNPRDIVLPGLAAVAGMALPAGIYAWINWGNPTITGWAIPAATDIAFALGILALVGSRAPTSLKLFLLTLAILDDIGAILIIAVFYTAELKVNYLFLSMIPFAIMVCMNLYRAHSTAPFLILATIMWYFMLKSGVHATIAGVLAAFCVPLIDRWGKSPLHSLERSLHPYVNFIILPVFAFANAGVVLTGIAFSDLFSPVPLGIAAGLVVGKQAGVLAITWLVVKSGLARMPHGANYMHIYGVACLAGVGFTMSLFIGGLSFVDPELLNDVRLGVLSGSILSGIMGYAALRMAPAVAD